MATHRDVRFLDALLDRRRHSQGLGIATSTAGHPRLPRASLRQRLSADDPQRQIGRNREDADCNLELREVLEVRPAQVLLVQPDQAGMDASDQVAQQELRQGGEQEQANIDKGGPTEKGPELIDRLGFATVLSKITNR